MEGGMAPSKAIFLGLGFDPLGTKPGILTALVIDAAQMSKEALKFTKKNSEGNVFSLPIDQLNNKWINHRKMLPDGTGCLQLAQQHLEFFRQDIKNRP
jgi:hypothetical protein